ncbi:MAG TPA: 50S ribosomal protein L15e [Candidatus Diapherotrites archaeon]|uniref:50S ribosomal protein L15e n=1 Tax=Candidatus Iainarchaeum sp. TaxID=3101447 RepID=A0A7J4J1V7_9ARCH|nr:50S ribosomal protein L15e [Candidatus Diapherotrites archaeon]
MSFSQHVKKTIQLENLASKSKDYAYGALFRQRVFDQRQSDEAVVRAERPSNLPRARSLGYKAKAGFIIAVVRVRKGSGMHRRPARGRKPKRMGVKKLTRRLSKKSMAERKAGVKFPNCEVLNSYWAGEDGKSTYFEVILAERDNPGILADKNVRWVALGEHRRRAERGLTSEGKKGRGLIKGKGHEKNYPSMRAHDRTAK